MAVTRADTLTSTIKKQEYFSDFLDSFAVSPVGGELGKVVNERSVTQSIKNLIMTSLGERLFQPTVGSNIYNSLFEFNDNLTNASIEFNIANTLKYNEPRCNLISVNVSSTDDYSLQVTITYALINNPEPITINFMLQRVR
jgi:phage baseplate assembly protein W